MNKERIRHSKGYWLIYRPGHPYANHSGYVPEHRLVLEETLGRFINPSIEDPHHKDEVVTNNNKDNLKLCTKKEHRRAHAGWEFIEGKWWKYCTGCGRFLNVEENFYKRKVGHNEYVTRCIQCCHLISRKSIKLSHEERSQIAVSCAYRGWDTRRKNITGSN